MAIPKIIHYCWFGNGEKTKMVQKCIQSWKTYCPDYQIICWNEKNYDISKSCPFVQQAYEYGTWAFVSDYVRLAVVYRMGGIYLDTDVELLKPLDELIADGDGFWGFENEQRIASGLGFAAIPGEPILKEMLMFYENLSFEPQKMDKIKCPIINTNIMKQHGLLLNGRFQYVEGRIKILPMDYLSPEDIATGKTNYTENTVSIHHYAASWQPKRQRCRNQWIIRCKKILPLGMVQWIRSRVRKMRKSWSS